MIELIVLIPIIFCYLYSSNRYQDKYSKSKEYNISTECILALSEFEMRKAGIETVYDYTVRINNDLNQALVEGRRKMRLNPLKPYNFGTDVPNRKTYGVINLNNAFKHNG